MDGSDEGRRRRKSRPDKNIHLGGDEVDGGTMWEGEGRCGSGRGRRVRPQEGRGSREGQMSRENGAGDFPSHV